MTQGNFIENESDIINKCTSQLEIECTHDQWTNWINLSKKYIFTHDG